jgi:hypothetical protein
MPNLTLRASAVGAAIAAALAAGGGTSAMAAAATPVRASVRCNFTAIDKAVVARIKGPGSNVWLIKQNVKCSGNWAVAFPDVGPTKTHSNTVTIVLKWNGKAWQLKSRAGTTCKSPGHDVPAPIFKQACETN